MCGGDGGGIPGARLPTGVDGSRGASRHHASTLTGPGGGVSSSPGHGSCLPEPQGVPRTSVWSPVNTQKCATRVRTQRTHHAHTTCIHVHAHTLHVSVHTHALQDTYMQMNAHTCTHDTKMCTHTRGPHGLSGATTHFSRPACGLTQDFRDRQGPTGSARAGQTEKDKIIRKERFISSLRIYYKQCQIFKM